MHVINLCKEGTAEEVASTIAQITACRVDGLFDNLVVGSRQKGYLKTGYILRPSIGVLWRVFSRSVRCMTSAKENTMFPQLPSPELMATAKRIVTGEKLHGSA